MVYARRARGAARLVLPLALKPGAAPAAPGCWERAQLALRSAVHIPHPADDGVRLVVQVEAVVDQFFELDFGRPFRSPAVEAAPVAAVATAITAPFAPTFASAFAPRWPARGGPPWGEAPLLRSAAFARRTAFLPLLLLLCHF